MEFDAFSADGVSQALDECNNCGRRFNSVALSRHIPICAKSSQKQRKVFNSSKQRAEGTEIGTVRKSQVKKPLQATQRRVPPQKNNWRSKHEDFINTIRAARGVQKALDNGLPLPPPPPPTINPDYVQCPYCSRRFNETAADRHINFCKEQHSRLPGKKPDASATAKFAARKQYQVPRPASKASPGSATKENTSYTRTGSTRNTPGTMKNNSTMRNNNSNMNSSNSHSSYSASRYSDHGTESPHSGRALRTGRTAEMYTDARELSAKQRSNMPRKNTPVKASTRYGDYGASNTGTSHRPGFDNGYHSGESDSLAAAASKQRIVGSGLSKFCHDCGSKYPVSAAKFCCECGVRRVNIH